MATPVDMILNNLKIQKFKFLFKMFSCLNLRFLIFTYEEKNQSHLLALKKKDISQSAKFVFKNDVNKIALKKIFTFIREHF